MNSTNHTLSELLWKRLDYLEECKKNISTVNFKICAFFFLSAILTFACILTVTCASNPQGDNLTLTNDDQLGERDSAGYEN